MLKKLVIVESPTKARTIRKFLDKSYIVESCMGHIRDLPQSAREVPEKFKKEKWAHLGVNVDKEFEPIYCVPKTKVKVVEGLKKKLRGADEVILATDEDREGREYQLAPFGGFKTKGALQANGVSRDHKNSHSQSLKGFSGCGS